MKAFDWFCLAVVVYLIICVPLAWHADNDAAQYVAMTSVLGVRHVVIKP